MTRLRTGAGQSIECKGRGNGEKGEQRTRDSGNGRMRYQGTEERRVREEGTEKGKAKRKTQEEK